MCLTSHFNYRQREQHRQQHYSTCEAAHTLLASEKAAAVAATWPKPQSWHAACTNPPRHWWAWDQGRGVVLRNHRRPLQCATSDCISKAQEGPEAAASVRVHKSQCRPLYHSWTHTGQPARPAQLPGMERASWSTTPLVDSSHGNLYYGFSRRHGHTSQRVEQAQGRQGFLARAQPVFCFGSVAAQR